MIFTRCYCLPGMPVFASDAAEFTFDQWYDEYMLHAEQMTEVADWIRDERNTALGLMYDGRNYKQPYFDI